MSQRFLTLATCFFCAQFALLQVLASSGEIWGGKRTSILVNQEIFNEYAELGIQFAAIKLNNLPSDAGTQFIPADKANGNGGTQYMLSACENTKGFKVMNDAVAQCDKTKCPDDFLLVEYWGTLPGMNWPKDGVLLFSCQVLQIPKKCSAPDANCLTTAGKTITSSLVSDAVAYMANGGDDVRMITQPSNNVGNIIKMLADYKAKTGDNIGIPTGGGQGKHGSSKGDKKGKPTGP